MPKIHYFSNKFS